MKRIDPHFLVFLAALAFCLPPHFCAAQKAKSVRAALPAAQQANAALSKESRKLLQVADMYSKAEQYAQALQYYAQISLKHPDDLYVCYQLGECHRHLFSYTLAEAAYGKVSYADTDTYPKAVFYYALMQKMNGRYAHAMQGFDSFTRNAAKLDEAKLPGKKQWLDRAKLEHEGCQFALLREKFAQGDFGFAAMAAPVSSPAHDYAPMLAGSDSVLLITSGRSDRKKPLDGRLGEGFSDFHRYARQTDTTWAAATDKLLTINTQWNDGTGCLSADRTRFYFTSCQGSDVNCAIFATEYKNSRWQKPVRLNAHINQPGGDSRHPALSPRGDTLYFVSDRAGGFGMNDIWRSVRTGKNDWSQPVNLGNKVNTAQNDISPFLYHAANQLFFASDGWLGLGGLDIYYTSLSDNTGRQATNLGPPFNSNRDDAFMVLGSEKGFLASNREGGMGNFDIYTFFNKSRYVELLALSKTKETLRPDLAYLSEFEFEYLPDAQKLLLDRLVGKKTAGKLYQTDMPLTEEEKHFHARLSAAEQERLERMTNTLFSRRDTAALKAEDDYQYGKLLAEEDRQRIARFAEAYRMALRDGEAPKIGQSDGHFYESLTHEERHQLHRQIAARLGGRTGADAAGLLDEDGYFYEQLSPQEKDRIARMAAARHAARLNAHDEGFRDDDADFYAKLPPDGKERLDRILDRWMRGLRQPLDSNALSAEDGYFYAQLSAEEKQRLNRMAAARNAARMNGTDEKFHSEDQSHYDKLPPDEKDRLNRFAAAWMVRNRSNADGSLLSDEDLFRYEQLTPQEKERLERMAAARHAARLNGKDGSFSEADQYYYESLSPAEKARMGRLMRARAAAQGLFGEAALLAGSNEEFAFARMPLENSILGKGQTRRRIGTKLTADESMINGTTADDALSKLNASWLGKYKEVTLSGRLMDAQTNQPAAGLLLPLVDRKGKIVKTTTTNADGTFQYLNLPLSEDLRIRIETPLTLMTDSRLLYVEDMQLTAHKNTSTASVSTPAYFDFDSYVLKRTTGRLLDSLVEYYRQNPAIQIELNAFADEVGSEDYNLRLSNKRGLAVQKYLVGKGVLPGSIVIYARGETSMGGKVPNRTAPRRNAAQRKVSIAIQDTAIENRLNSETFVILPETELSVISGKVKVSVAELRKLNGFKTDTVEPYRPIRIR